MIKSVKIYFNKLKHDTGKAILVSIDENEIWLPKKLCRNLKVHNKLNGSVCIPTFLAEKNNIQITDENIDIEVIHHIPIEQKKEVNYDESLFK